MNKYELAIIFKPSFELEEKNAHLESVKEMITKNEGVIDKIDDLGKRRLAYEIAKVKEGYYCFIKFTANANVPLELEQKLRITDSVLRYLVVKE